MWVRPTLLVSLAFPLFTAGCWSDTNTLDRGELVGFKIGATKRAVFETAHRNQIDGLIADLELLDQPSSTYNDKYKGVPIRLEDYERVSVSDKWHIGLPDCNSWLVLIFTDGALVKIEEHEWTGPTK